MKNMVGSIAIGCIALCLLSGCKTDAASKDASAYDNRTGSAAQHMAASPSTAAVAMPVAVGSGSITGTVTFSGKVPSYPAINTDMDPACSLGKAGSTLPVEQIVSKEGKLANVFVYVKSGPPTAMEAGPQRTAAVVMDQVGCQYVPHVVGVMQGGSVEFRNSDPTMHNIHTMPAAGENEPIDVSQGPRGTPQIKRFAKAELMLPVRCNNHPWMNAFINVSPTAFFSVSNSTGHFDLGGLPAGQYTIAAVHEKLGEQDLQVTVPTNAAAKLDFSFRSK